ncbi:Carbohydrate binding domain-containing protein [Verrucomicrobium sp. GAS474]|uniref:carbohydrate binding domain-containing protein n=1 Tax=Verrucomicrobium sp. GAS474 TaxID=1882831 RepID=UPI00087AA2BF|nr:carbohydrate binding domain-containing protein [Verrucomicrobium sp. GAS474]SDT92934.1 Carbohydrate binding domain-containing protein [Verrucomicrobium sp. GAS474]
MTPFRRSLFPFFLLVLLSGGVLALPARSEEANLMANPGFEEADSTAWRENNWGKLDAEYALDPENPHAGRFSKRVTLRKTGPADLQWTQFPLEIKAAGSYRVRFWLRGRSNTGAVRMSIRKMAPPYTNALSYEVSPSEDWKEYVFDFTLPQSFDTKMAGIVFSIHDETTFWLDDVSMTPLPAVSEEPAVSGNRIPNGSFELGRDGWTGTFRERRGMADAMAAQEANVGAEFAPVKAADAPQGKRVLRFEVREGARAMLTTGYFPLRYGHPATIGFWMKADAPDRKLLVHLANGLFPNIAWQGKEFTSPDAEWHRYTFPVLPQPEFGGRYCLEMATADAAVYQLDDVTATEDDLPAAAPVVFQAGSEPAPGNDPASLFDKGEKAAFLLHVLSDKARTLTVHVVDAWGREIKTFPVAVPAAPTEAADIPLVLPTALYGGFKCVVDDPLGGPLPAAEIIYAVLPPVKAASEVKEPFFGTHADLTPYNLHIASRAGFRLLRLWPPLITIWAAVEPTPGNWSFETRGLERATKMGFRFLGMLGSTPASEADAPTPADAAKSNWFDNWPPKDWDAWRGYIGRSLKAYGPYIKEWEVWNEPDGGGFLRIPAGKSRPQVYVDIVKNAFPAFPPATEARFSGGVVTTLSRPFTREILDLGVASCLDAYSTHYYEMSLGIGPEENQLFLDRLAEVRAQKGRSGKPLDVLVTEFSADKIKSWLDGACLPGNGMTVAEGAALLTRTTIALKALGIKEAYQYAGFAQPSGRIAYRDGFADYIEVNGAPRPALAAQAAMAHFLEEASAAGLVQVQLEAGGGKATVASFLLAGRKTDVVWAKKPVKLGEIAAVPFAGRSGYDMMGNPVALSTDLPVGPDPLYLVQEAKH